MRETGIPISAIQPASAPLAPPMPVAAVRRIALLGNPTFRENRPVQSANRQPPKSGQLSGRDGRAQIGRYRDPRRPSRRSTGFAWRLQPASDQALTRDIITGNSSEPPPELLVCGRRHPIGLEFATGAAGATSEVMVLALNMSDMARAQGITIDTQALSTALGMPVVSTVGVKRGAQHRLNCSTKPHLYLAQPEAALGIRLRWRIFWRTGKRSARSWTGPFVTPSASGSGPTGSTGWRCIRYSDWSCWR